jgi:iron-sulfur cluster repair protein YtfE (RIC family)
MAITDNLKKQHKEISDIVKQISVLLNPDVLSQDAEQAGILLSKLTENLELHLAWEDEALYPALQRHPKEEVRILTKVFSEEMGGISKTFARYTANWPNAAAIQNDPDSFINESRDIFASLSSRINQENNHLYPLLEVK